MPVHSDEQINAAAERLERRLDELDPDTIKLRSIEELRAVADAAAAVRTAEAQVRERVEIARRNGQSWNLIALALGVSRQAARQRFTDKPKP